MLFATEILPGVVAALILIAMMFSLVKSRRRVLSAEKRADYAESQMRLVMRFRGVTHEQLEQLDCSMKMDP